MLTQKETNLLIEKIQSGNYSVEDALADIASAQYGEDVRAAIYSSIYTCYKDGKAGAIDLIARAQLAEAIAGVTEDSEIKDVRVAADGGIYATAGEAVRWQVTGLQKNVSALGRVADEQLYDPDNVTTGYYISYDKGQQLANEVMCFQRSPVVPGKTLYTTPHYLQIAFFDREGAFISGRRFNDADTLNVPFNVIIAPEGAATMALSTHTKYRHSFVCSYDVKNIIDNEWMLPDGDINRRIEGSYTDIDGGRYLVENLSNIYRKGISGALYQKLSWRFEITTAGTFAFGTRDDSGSIHGLFCSVDCNARTLKIYDSDWANTYNIRRNLTFDFPMLSGEKYAVDVYKKGTYSLIIKMYCVDDPTKTFEYEHTDVMNNKIRVWGCIGFRAGENASYTIYQMYQRADCDERSKLAILGDSFVECANNLMSSSDSFAHLVREDLGEKCHICGMGGATTNTLIRQLPDDFMCTAAKYTFLQIGANDSISLDIETYKANILFLIDCIKAVGSEPVLTTIPIRGDVDNTAFAYQANAWISSLGYKYINEYALLNGHLLSDNIHPNESGNKIIYNALRFIVPDAF